MKTLIAALALLSLAAARCSRRLTFRGKAATTDLARTVRLSRAPVVSAIIASTKSSKLIRCEWSREKPRY